MDRYDCASKTKPDPSEDMSRLFLMELRTNREAVGEVQKDLKSRVFGLLKYKPSI